MASVDWEYWMCQIMLDKYLLPCDLIKLPNRILKHYGSSFLFDLMAFDYKDHHNVAEHIPQIVDFLKSIDLKDSYVLHGYMYSFFRFDPNRTVLRVLLRNATNKDMWSAVTPTGNTPFHYFAKRNKETENPEDKESYLSMVECEYFPVGGLFASLCNIKNNEGNTPLQEFFKYCDFSCMLRMMNHLSKRSKDDCRTKVDMSLCDSEGKTYHDLIGLFNLSYTKDFKIWSARCSQFYHILETC